MGVGETGADNYIVVGVSCGVRNVLTTMVSLQAVGPQVFGEYCSSPATLSRQYPKATMQPLVSFEC